MKKLIIIALILFIASTVYAAPRRWCQWDGTSAMECQTEKDGAIFTTDGTPLTSLAEANAAGFYRTIISQPELGVDQKKGAMLQSLVGNEILVSWEVVDLTQEEIDLRDATAMPLSEYYLWRVLLANDLITIQQARAILPQEVIDAYQARNRLENP